MLFLDEPTVGLDPTARRLVWERLHALREDAGTTIVVTTHLMEEAERHCDRLAIMDHGRLVEQGEPAELLQKHARAGPRGGVRHGHRPRARDRGEAAGCPRCPRRVARRLG